MGVLSQASTLAFQAEQGIVIGAFALNFLVSLIQVADPSYFDSGQTGQLLNSIAGLTWVTFLSHMLNNSYISMMVSGAGTLVAFILSLNSQLQSFTNTAFVLLYVAFFFSNALTFFAYWIPSIAVGSIVYAQIMAIDSFITSVMGALTVVYIMMTLGYLPSNL